MKTFARVVLLLVLAFAGSVAALAQMTSGDIVGLVTDGTGASIPAAKVHLENVETGVSYNTVASAQGEYRISNLPPGIYNVTASAAGFNDSLVKGFRVELNKAGTLPIKLAPSMSTAIVEVASDASVALDTTSVQLQQTFSNQEVTALPTSQIGLGVLNTSLLSPNVATSGGVGAGTGPSVGGQRPRANNFTIEGIDNNNKSVTGPLVYVPSDSVDSFTLITNQFSPEFGHSAGGQFNTTVLGGSNKFHGRAYEFFDNRDLNAIDASTARSFAADQKPFNSRYDNNRYGGQLGGPIFRDRLFFFGNFERQTIGQSATYPLCTPTAEGFAALQTVPGLSATNLGIYTKYTPVSPSQIDAANDGACFNQDSGAQSLTVYSGTTQNADGEFASGTPTVIPLGNYQVSAPSFSNFDALTTSVDYTLSSKDNFRGRYIYNTQGNSDTAASLPAFFSVTPNRFHLFALSEFHSFTPSLTNEARIGFNRYYNATPVGNFTYPGLDSFPNITINDQGFVNIGPDGNAPQSTIQNLYQLTDNVGWVKGKHSFKFGFDGRKYISPQSFTQRVRGDYQYNNLTEYLHDLAPTYFGERSTGDFFYYGDQTALYAYGNDTWRVSPKIALNFGLRYEFTSVPSGERVQSLNAAASVPGLINFSKPEPQYKNFAPRVGIDWSPDEKTSVRAGFGMAYDVLYDNLGILSFPPQFSSTNDVGAPNSAQPGDPNFLGSGGLPAGNGTLGTFDTVEDQRGATSAYVPNQTLPYAESYSLGVQRVFHSNYTLEVRYLGTRGIHLSTQTRINRQASVDETHFLPTYTAAPSQAALDSLTNTLASIRANKPSLIPAYAAAGFASNVVSFAPSSSSNYNSLGVSLTRRMSNGLAIIAAYTWSKTMDDATADVFSTVLSPRRAQDWLNVSKDYSRSALDRTHRLSIATIYDLPYYKNSTWLLKNLVGNWEVAPIYTYQSPEFATAQSGIDANLNGDAAGDRFVVNPSGDKSLTSDVTALKNTAGTTVAYLAKVPGAYYIRAQSGALANGGRNTVPLRPINDVDATVSKRINVTERVAFEFQAQAFNVFNHPQFVSGKINTVDSVGDTAGLTSSFLRVGNAAFSHPELAFASNARTLQLALKMTF